MLKLYHFQMSVTSQKVRLALAHKGLDFESQTINVIEGEQHADEYVKLNPMHVVPTLQHDGKTFIESTQIIEYLEDAFPEKPILPKSPAARYAARMLTRYIDDKVHPVAGMVTFAIGPRSLMLAHPPAKLEYIINSIPDPPRRAARGSVVKNGIAAPEFPKALATMVEMVDKFEKLLGKSEWLSGDAFGMADMSAAPYVLRLDHLSMTPVIQARPKLSAWFERVQRLPAWAKAVDAWILDHELSVYRSNGAKVWDDVQRLLKK